MQRLLDLIKKYKKYIIAVAIVAIPILIILLAVEVDRESKPSMLPPIIKVEEGTQPTGSQAMVLIKADPPSGTRQTGDYLLIGDFTFSLIVDPATVEIVSEPNLEFRVTRFEKHPNVIRIDAKNGLRPNVNYNITIKKVSSTSGETLNKPIYYKYFNDTKDMVRPEDIPI